ncbi:MAG: dGTPase [Novosphingobium sp.]|nr:dGTPase [Novosphingobium sp.]
MSDRWSERRSGAQRHGDDVRTDFEVDYARVIHSSAFRRLQGKTQILSLGDDDFYRTRLTHSLEVAQVAEGIAQHLRASKVDPGLDPAAHALVPPAPLIQAIGLAHDIGHPPFGHGGELALNYCMRGEGGFEGNAQTLRILARLESFSAAHGADLTRRALLGTLKYPALHGSVRNRALTAALADGATTIAVLDRARCKPAKACYDDDAHVLDWILAPLSPGERTAFLELDLGGKGHGRTRHKSFDCGIMNAADDIAYGVHDLEDAIALGFIREEEFVSAIGEAQCGDLLAALVRRPLMHGGCGDYSELTARLFGSASARKGAIGRLVHYFIRAVELSEDDMFDTPLLRWHVRLRGEAAALLAALQALIVRQVIESPRVQHLEFKGQRMVVAVFEALASDPARLLPPDVQERCQASSAPLRAICDHVAGFTDAALLRTYERLFSPRMGSVFDRV